MTQDAPKAPALAGDFVVGEWLVRPSLSRMWRGETVVRLRPQLVDLLVCLARHPTRTLSKGEILDTVWPGQYILESGLARCVTELRQALGDQAQNPRYIETIPKRGYRLIVPVRWLEPSESAALPGGAGVTAAADGAGQVAVSAGVCVATPAAGDLAPAAGDVTSESTDADSAPPVPPAPPAIAAVLPEPVGAAGAEPPAPATLRGRRRLRRLAPILAASLLVVAAVVAVMMWRARRPSPAAQPGTVLVTFDNSTRDPVFDGALGLALAIQLEQSPLLTVLPDARLKEQLRFMGRPAGEPMTRALALEACQRAGAKALLAGSISALGTRYVLGLEGVGCQSGATLVRHQVEVDRKEDVLAGLGEAASHVRQRLGESVASIRRHDVPIIQATTASLDALKAVSQGDAERALGRDAQAIDLYRQAIELDRDFALAHARLAAHLLNLERTGEAVEALKRAFALSGRVSVPERYSITGFYYSRVVRDPFRAIEAFQTWRDLYPRDPLPRMALASLYNQTGRFDQGLQEGREAERLDPNHAIVQAVILESLLGQGRWDDVRKAGQRLVAQDRANVNVHLMLFETAFVQGDGDAMRRELEWAAGNKMAESSFLDLRASAAAFSGQLTTAGPLWQQESSLARARGDSTEAALALLQNAEAYALVGQREEAVRLVARAESESRAPECLQRAAAVLGLAGEAAGAERLAEEARRTSPDPSSDPETRPLVAALIELRRGRASAAIEALAALRPFEAGPRFGLRPTLVRGLALMQEGRARDAAAEFQRILDHRSVLALDVIYPVACLHLSRALAAAGDPAGAARARQAVLGFWTHADSGLPLLDEARRVP